MEKPKYELRPLSSCVIRTVDTAAKHKQTSMPPSWAIKNLRFPCVLLHVLLKAMVFLKFYDVFIKK